MPLRGKLLTTPFYVGRDRMGAKVQLTFAPFKCGVYQANTSQHAGDTRSQNRLNRTHHKSASGKHALTPPKPIATTENLLHRQPLHHIPRFGMYHKHIYPCRPAPHRKSCLVGLPLHRQVSFTVRPIYIYSVHPALRLHRHFLPRRIRHHPHSIPISRSIYPCPLSSPGHTPAPVAITQRVTVSAHHPHIRYHTVSSMQRVYILPTIVITCFYST